MINRSNTGQSYRPDIDGLRGLAILLVVIFHFFPKVLPAGFLGVDIFFVVSGYLICSQIFKQIDSKSFSFIDFYFRRVRRLFPALVGVSAIMIFSGYFILFPDEFKILAEELFAGFLFVANFLFMDQNNYFDPIAEQQPFLHLWSLGIEEQFYLIFPLIAFISFLFRFKWTRVTFYPLFISLVFFLGVSVSDQNAAFYLPITRFWEILLGGQLAALEISKGQQFEKRYSQIYSPIGLIMIFVGLVVISGSAKLMGIWTLLPTLGATLIIYSGGKSFLNFHLFSQPWIVWIGLISYPLYLWHWPLLYFARIYWGDDLSSIHKIVFIFISIILSWTTYRWLELPLRRRNSQWGLIAAALMILIFVSFVKFDLVSSRKNDPALSELFAATKDWDYPGKKMKSYKINDFDIYSYGKNAKTILFAGDSNAEQYWPRVEYLIDNNVNAPSVIFVTGGSCAPIPGIYFHERPGCYPLTSAVLELSKQNNISDIILTAVWVTYFSDKRTMVFKSSDGDLRIKPNSDGYRQAIESLKKFILELKSLGKRVWIISTIPWGKEYEPLRLVDRFFTKNAVQLRASTTPRAKVEERVAPLKEELRKIAEETGSEFIDPIPFLCSNEICPLLDDSMRPLYKDALHFRPFYAREKITYIDQIFNSSTSRLPASSIKSFK